MRRADTWVRRALRLLCMLCGTTGTVNGGPCPVCRSGAAGTVA
jgi:hypothetical protein